MIASDLLLVRLDKSKEYIYNNNSKPKASDIVELKLIGYVIGDDRCLGSFANIYVMGNQIKIKQHQGDLPLDCEKIKAYPIDLTKLSKPF